MLTPIYQILHGGESSVVLKIELGIIYMHITNPMYPTNQLCMKLSVLDILQKPNCFTPYHSGLLERLGRGVIQKRFIQFRIQ